MPAKIRTLVADLFKHFSAEKRLSVSHPLIHLANPF
jgi:hypothetical protein